MPDNAPIIRLRLVELYDRGMNAFESLSPLEKDVFVVHDLTIYYEMEGGFEEYVLSGGNETQLSWLSGTLERIGDTESAALIAELRQLGESDRDAMSLLCNSFDSIKERRWDLLLGYLRGQGAVVDA